MPLTEPEVLYDQMWIRVCEHKYDRETCICGYHSHLEQVDDTRGPDQRHWRLANEMLKDYKALVRRGIDVNDLDVDMCPPDPLVACATCPARWWCDPDFWIMLYLGEIDENSHRIQDIPPVHREEYKSPAVRFPKGGSHSEPGHPPSHVEGECKHENTFLGGGNLGDAEGVYCRDCYKWLAPIPEGQ